MGLVGFIVGLLVTIGLFVLISWGLMGMWNVLVVYGLPGIAVFLLALILLLPCIVIAYVGAIIPMIIGGSL